MPEIPIKPLGDSAVLAYLPNEAFAIAFADTVRTAGFEWLVDLVPAYSSVGVFFDSSRTNLKTVRRLLQTLAVKKGHQIPGRLHVIPCCYVMELDLNRIARHCGLDPDRVIELHTSTEYTVHAVGFAPGFPYLGYLPNEIAGVPRLDSPRLRVEPGSVGLTARQTGIYPIARPGGWNLIGRTPLEIVNVGDGYFPIRIGDRVRFQRIDEAEFTLRLGERLSSSV